MQTYKLFLKIYAIYPKKFINHYLIDHLQRNPPIVNIVFTHRKHIV